MPVLSTPAQPLSLQPRPDSVEYADGAWQLGHGHGYVTFFDERHNAFGTRPLPPRYPFGTSAALAPFAFLDGRFPQGPQLGARVISAFYVLTVVAASWLLGGPLAAAFAAMMVGLSPFAHVSATMVLSDALAATLTVGILLATRFAGTVSASVAGALAGALVCVRLMGVFALPAALLAFRGRRRAVVAACAMPFLIALGVYQWRTFGSPLKTGYDYWVSASDGFSPAFLFGHPQMAEGPFVYPDRLGGSVWQALCPCPLGGPMVKLSNAVFYPSVATGLFWVFAPPLTGLLGMCRLFTRPLTRPAKFTLAAVFLNVGLAVFYDVSAARFIAPAASLLIVYSAVAGSELVSKLGRLVPGWLRAVITPRGGPCQLDIPGRKAPLTAQLGKPDQL